MAGRFSVEAVFKAVDRVTAPINRMQRRVGKFSRSVSRSLDNVTRKLDRMRDGAVRFGRVALLSGALAGAGFADVVKTGAEFDQTITNAAAKFGLFDKSSDAFTRITKKAKETGEQTEFMASQAADALKFFAKAGFTPEAAMGSLAAAVDLATVAEVDLNEAANIATDSLGAFNLLLGDSATKSKNFARVTDLLAKAANITNFSLQELFDSLVRGAPTAIDAGASIEETTVILAAFANAGLKGSVAGVGLKRVMLAISAPTSAAGKTFRRLKVETREFVDGVKKIRPVLDIFDDMKKAIGGLDPADRAPVLDAIFGKISIAGASGLIKQSGETVRALEQKLKDYRGEAAKLAAFQRTTLLFSFKALNSVVETTKILTNDVAKKSLKVLVDKMTEWVRLNKDFIAQKLGNVLLFIVDNIDGIVKGIAAIGGTIIILTTLSFVIKGVAVAWMTFNFVIKAVLISLKAWNVVMGILNALMFANPIGLLVVGAIALALVGALVVTRWKKVKEFFTDFTSGLKNLFSNTWDDILLYRKDNFANRDASRIF